MFSKNFFLVSLLLMAFFILGCAQPNSGSANEVILANNQFSPQAIQINSGDTVTWKNNGGVQHTVTGFGVDESLSPGQAFSHTFNQTGTFDYECTIHQGMNGTVTVN